MSHFGGEWRWGIWGELVGDFGEGMLVKRDGTPAAEWGFVQLGFHQNPGLEWDVLGTVWVPGACKTQKSSPN